MTKKTFSKRIESFTESVYSEFTILANKYQAVNLGQGFPDWEPPSFVREATVEKILNTSAQYARARGDMELVNELADWYGTLMNRKIDAQNEILGLKKKSEFC
jgi:kynurenine--oxoglutarate transaminase/cysteine-S-conjugate beta-lyase/glutamine--phenylpyruvate transaminase